MIWLAERVFGQTWETRMRYTNFKSLWDELNIFNLHIFRYRTADDSEIYPQRSRYISDVSSVLIFASVLDRSSILSFFKHYGNA